MSFLYLTRTVHMPVTVDGSTIKNSFGVVIATAVDPITASAMADLINLGRPAAEEAERRQDANERRAAMLMRSRFLTDTERRSEIRANAERCRAADARRQTGGPAAMSTATLGTRHWTVDTCPDANGFATIRRADGSPTGNTDAQPIATVYDWKDAPVTAAAPRMRAALSRILDGKEVPDPSNPGSTIVVSLPGDEIDEICAAALAAARGEDW